MIRRAILVTILMVSTTAHAGEPLSIDGWHTDEQPYFLIPERNLQAIEARGKGVKEPINAGLFRYVVPHPTKPDRRAYYVALRDHIGSLRGRDLWVLTNVERTTQPAAPREHVVYRDRTVEVPVDRAVEKTVEVPAALVIGGTSTISESTWSTGPATILTDGVLTYYINRSEATLSADGATASLSCAADPPDARRIATYVRLSAHLVNGPPSARAIWILTNVSTPARTVERRVEVPVEVRVDHTKTVVRKKYLMPPMLLTSTAALAIFAAAFLLGRATKKQSITYTYQPDAATTRTDAEFSARLRDATISLEEYRDRLKRRTR